MLSTLWYCFSKALLLCEQVPPGSCRTFHSRSQEGASRHCKESWCPFPGCSPNTTILPVPGTLAQTSPLIMFSCLVSLQVNLWRCITILCLSELRIQIRQQVGSMCRWKFVFSNALCCAVTVCFVGRITSSSGQMRALFFWALYK